MGIEDFINQLNKIEKRELEQKIWEFWLVKYPLMTENDFETYEEMLERVKNQQIEINKEPEYITADQGGLF